MYNEYETLKSRNLKDAVITSHGITKQALALLKGGDIDGFIQSRQQKLMELEKNFMQARNVQPGPDFVRDYELDDTN